MNILQQISEMVTEPVEAVSPHVGEVMSLWTYYAAAEALRAALRIAGNHTNDKELSQALAGTVTDILNPQIDKLTAVMKREGVPFPTQPAEVATTAERDIPPGVKLTEMTIANRLVAGLEGLMVTANAGLMQALRDDLGLLFLQIHSQLIAQAQIVKKLMRRRGWLQVPPPYATNRGDQGMA